MDLDIVAGALEERADLITAAGWGFQVQGPGVPKWSMKAISLSGFRLAGPKLPSG
jgi:hypothetical protein